MRHLRSALAGVVTAPAVWLLLGYGQRWSADAHRRWDSAGVFHTTELLPAVGLLAGAAALVAVLILPRFSPAGALAAGLLLAAPVAVTFYHPLVAVDRMQATSVMGRDIPLSTPVVDGTLLVVALLLIAAAGRPGRWRAPAPERAAAAGTAAPADDRDRLQPATTAGAAGAAEDAGPGGDRPRQPAAAGGPADEPATKRSTAGGARPQPAGDRPSAGSPPRPRSAVEEELFG